MAGRAAARETGLLSGLASHPQHELAKQQQRRRHRAFEVDGGKEAAWQLIDTTRMLSITANLGDTKSTITHPATTTHGRLTPEQRPDAGISDGLIRISVGLEDLEDIKKDLEHGLSLMRSGVLNKPALHDVE